MLLFAATAAGSGPLRGVDQAIVGLYLATMVAVGVWAGRGQTSTLDYFLGDRNLPWWAVLLSIVATETSTVTFLSIPGLAFAAGGDFRFLQITFGYAIGRVLVALILLPLYFRGEPFTAYEVLEQRFGRLSRRATSLLFLVMRNLADGLRLYLTALVLREATGMSLTASIGVMGVVTVAYTYWGGVKSVVWNDCLQFAIYILGAVAALLTMTRALPGGWSQLQEFAATEGKLRLWDFDASLTAPTMTFWAGLIGGAFLTGSTHGIDQLTVQRLLAARSQREARWSLVLSGLVIVAQFALFLTIGVALAAFYQQFPPATPFGPKEGDRVFAHYIVRHLPAGLVGLTLAAALAAAMSTLSGSLNSSATVLVKDLVAPLRRTPLSEPALLRLSRAATIAFGVVQIGVALASVALGVETGVVNSVLTIAAFASGPLLGLYLLGVLTSIGQRPALGGFLIGLAGLSTVALQTAVAWPWYSAIGAAITFVGGVGLSAVLSEPSAGRTTGLLLMSCVLWPGGVLAYDLPHVPPERLALDPRRFEFIAPAIEREIAAGQLAGCVVAVGRTGGVGYLEAFGQRQIEPTSEPMTVETVFDMASVTKPVATATSIMLLIERGQVRLQEPVATYVPEFAQNGKELITVEQLLTHHAGLIPDNSLDDYVDGPAKAWERIYALAPDPPPGTKFVYSDVGFEVLGEIVRRVTGQDVAAFAAANTFGPLGMSETGYLPAEALRRRAAPTEQRDGQWLKGEVHDPRAALLGGVAGHAGLFSTASDLAVYADAMLRLLRPRGAVGAESAGRKGPWPPRQWLSRAAAAEMVRPRDLGEGNQRALGWDVHTSYTKNRGDGMTERAFGHGGFTGTAMWIDPKLDLFVIFLSTRLHPDGVGEVNRLAGRVGAIAAGSIRGPRAPAATGRAERAAGPGRPIVVAESAGSERVRCGIDVLASDQFTALRGKRIGLVTNHTGLARDGRRTIDVLAAAPEVTLAAIFSPEHGLEGRLDQSDIADARDEATGLPVYSLYGASRKPAAERLADLDAVVFDIQDIGARFYTYISTMGLTMEATAAAGKEFVVLDRPNPLGGVTVAGPLADAGRESFVGWHTLPLQHGLTVGELARLFQAERRMTGLKLTVVPVQGWRRTQWWDACGLTWVNPSPNMRSLTEATLYPGIGLLETTNLSVGRGTDTPFEVVGAPWIDERALARELNDAGAPGVRFVPIRFTPTASKFAGEACGGVNVVIVDRNAFNAVRAGLTVAVALRELYREEWDVDALDRLLINREMLAAIKNGCAVEDVLAMERLQTKAFLVRRQPYLLYED